jgi:glutathione S-transferase
VTDKFSERGLGPVVGDQKRGPYLSWLSYYTGVLEPAFMSKFMKVEVPVGTAGWVAVEEAIPFVVRTLTEGPYILGEKFSAADVLCATTFAMFASSPMRPKSDALETYVKRCIERPAYKRAQARDEG